jgi:ABC-type dipeptide/oligopeptide/nickel transport system permease subunit
MNGSLPLSMTRKLRQASLWLARGWLAAWLLLAGSFKIYFANHPEEGDLLAHLDRALEGPGKFFSLSGALGFDAFGRELLSLTAAASLQSLGFAALSVVLSCVIALFLGGMISLSNHFYSKSIERFIEGLLAFPSLLLALAWAAFRGSGWSTLLAALLLGSVPSLTRFVLVRARELQKEDYVLAARSYGAPPFRILRKHLSPALIQLLLLKAPVLLSHALLAEASLTFLGVGAPMGAETWGSLLAQGKDYLIEAPHISLGAGLPLVLLVLALQRISSSELPSRV